MPSFTARTSSGKQWDRRELPVQFFGVVRHAERADSWSARVNGKLWVETEDFRRRGPLDPPLSDAGLEAAIQIGERIKAFRSQCGTSTLVVVVSPYLRCLQTAISICNVLQDKVRILIDFRMGEVYGPSVMGSDEPSQRPTKSQDAAVQFCRKNGVTCADRSVGEWPNWPESLPCARRRYANRFLIYMSRSVRARRNFLLVTHADCVGAALRVMPSHRDSVVRSVEFGGFFLARRGTAPKAQWGPARGGAASSLFKARSKEAEEDVRVCSFASDMSHISKVEEEENDNLTAEIDSKRLWMAPPTCGQDQLSPVEEDTDAMPPESERPDCETDAAWQVQTYDISTTTKPGASPWEKHLKKVTQETALSQALIENLLGELSPDPLGGTRSSGGLKFGGWRACPRDEVSIDSLKSGSTAVFGESINGSELHNKSGSEGDQSIFVQSGANSRLSQSRLSSESSKPTGVTKIGSHGSSVKFVKSEPDVMAWPEATADIPKYEVLVDFYDPSDARWNSMHQELQANLREALREVAIDHKDSGSEKEGSPVQLPVAKSFALKMPGNFGARSGAVRSGGVVPSLQQVPTLQAPPTVQRPPLTLKIPTPLGTSTASAGAISMEMGGSRLMRRRQQSDPLASVEVPNTEVVARANIVAL